MPWAWQQNKVICDVCQESLTLEPHPPAQWCNEKHTAWACKVSEIKFRGKTIAWVCIGCAYTHDAQLLYGQSIHPFGQMWTWTTFTENTMPCTACQEFAARHVTRHLPKVIRELRRQDRSEEAMEALRRLRDRDPERASEMDVEMQQEWLQAPHRQQEAPRRPQEEPPLPPPAPPGLQPLPLPAPQEEPPLPPPPPQEWLQSLQQPAPTLLQTPSDQLQSLQQPAPTLLQTPSDQLIAGYEQRIEELQHGHAMRDAEVMKMKERLAKVAVRQRQNRPLTFTSWDSMPDYAPGPQESQEPTPQEPEDPKPQEPELPNAGKVPELHVMSSTDSDEVSLLSSDLSSDQYVKPDHDATWQFAK